MRQRIYKKVAHTQAFRTHFRLTWSPKPETGTRNPKPKPFKMRPSVKIWFYVLSRGVGGGECRVLGWSSTVMGVILLSQCVFRSRCSSTHPPPPPCCRWFSRAGCSTMSRRESSVSIDRWAASWAPESAAAAPAVMCARNPRTEMGARLRG